MRKLKIVLAQRKISLHGLSIKKQTGERLEKWSRMRRK